MSARALTSLIGDMLAADVCLADYLDTPSTTTHGSEDWCDQPVNQHGHPQIRRELQGWPGDFKRAIVTYGRLGRSFFTVDKKPWVESWTFVVGLWSRQTVIANDGERSPGDLWLLDMYDSVVRILGWEKGANGLVDCDDPLVLIARKEHVGNIVDLTFNESLGCWELQTRFRWIVISRGLTVPVPSCCET
jgi:hypothetical protein